MAATILIVDDDAAVATAMALLFSMLGYKTVVGENAAGVCAKFGSDEAPALVISDYHLRGAESGIEAIAKIRARAGREIPSILTSGDTSPAVRSAVASLANCHLVAKPANTEELIELVEHLVSGAP